MAFFKTERRRVVTLRTAWLIAEAAWTSTYVRFVLAFRPFRRVRGWLGTPQGPTSIVPCTSDLSLLRDVRRAVELCRRYAPWINCYAAALTAKIMLARRNVATTLFIGLRRDDQRKLAGHAWLMNGDVVVTGDDDVTAYAVHGRYQ